MAKLPQFEKLDEHTMKITEAKATNVPVYQVAENREMLIQKKLEIEMHIKRMDEILEKAKELGISLEIPQEVQEARAERAKKGKK